MTTERIEAGSRHGLKSVLLVLWFEDFADADKANVHELIIAILRQYAS